FGRALISPDSLRPCFIYEANAEGAGKGVLVKCATVPVLGSAPTSTAPKEESEMHKVLLTAVREGHHVVFFDNRKGHLSGEAIEAFLSGQISGGRFLGS